MEDYALVALDDYEDMHEYVHITDADPDAFEVFTDRCNALLRTTLVSHTRLVNAALVYCSLPEKRQKDPEAQVYAKTVQAFLGEDFDVTRLGKWDRLNGLSPAAAWNQLEGVSKSFVFYYNPDWEDVGGAEPNEPKEI